MIQIIAIIYLTIGILILLLGILIFRENPTKRINRITGLMMSLASLAPIMSAFGLMFQKLATTVEIDINIFQRIFLIWEFFFPQLLLFSFLFPKENALIKNYPKIVPLIFIPHTIRILLILLFESPESLLSILNFTETKINFVFRPFLLVLNLIFTLLSYLHEFQKNIFAFVNLIYVALAIFIMYQGYRRLENPRLQKQVRLVLWGIGLSVGLYAISSLIPAMLPIYGIENFKYFMVILILIVGPGSIALSIIRYQFLDIRLIIRRGIIFSITSGLLVGIYLLIYDHSKKVITGILGFDVPIVEIFFLIIAVIFFQPILSSIEEMVERVFVQSRYDFRNVIQTLSHEILHIVDLELLQEKVFNTLTKQFMIDKVFFILKDNAGDFTTEAKASLESHRLSFSRQGEFISLMRNIDEPVYKDDIVARLISRTDIQLLKQIDAFLLIPLIHPQELNGILCLGQKLTDPKYTAEDLSLLKLLGDQIGVAIANIGFYRERLERQRIEEEISLAREIQRLLLPREIPRGRNFEIAAINIPSKQVGGDYYDFISLDEHHLGIAIGDISGKGIPGALLMSNLQATFRASALHHFSTGETMVIVNDQLTTTTSSEKFATFFYGILDTQTMMFHYTNAGHNYPILRRKSGECIYLQEGGLIIGVQKNVAYPEASLKLDKGDVLVFYTDGITEALNTQQDEFSDQHLLKIICDCHQMSSQGLRDQIYEEVANFAKGLEQYDDITLIVLKIIDA
jgi:phosphoserine phosphatase RsbU/P